MSFAETCKILVNTETSFKDRAPHLLATGIGSYTQGLAGSVEFDYNDVYDREDRYSDVVGFYHTHPSGLNAMSPTDIQTMTQWVRCFGKSLICLIETEEKLNAWIFIKGHNGDISYREIKAYTGNDVNYDVWLEKEGNFWNPADFILEDFSEEELEEGKQAIFIDSLQDNLNELNEGQQRIFEGMRLLTDTVEQMIKVLTDESV